MAGKIIADTLEHSTAGSIATNYVVDGSAKAWCSANASEVIYDSQSLNISSLLDVDVGEIDFSLTNAVTSTSACVQATAGSGSARVGQTEGTPWADTSTIQYQCYSTGGTNADAGYNFIAVFGSLA